MKRGALIACCGSSPSTSMRTISCVCVCAWPCPPSVPNTSHGRPSRNAIAGISVCSGILPGPMPFGCASSSTNAEPRLCRLIPHSCTRRPEPAPLKFDWMRLTSMPSRSAVHMKIVPPSGAGMRCELRRARRGSIVGAPRRDPVVGEESLGRDRHRVGIAEVRVAVGERELHRLDQQVLAIGTVGAEVEAVDDAQRFERGHALRRRRHLEDLDVAERRAERFDPRARVRRDVGGGHEAAGFLDARRDRGADRAAVVRVGTVVARACGSCARARAGGSTSPARTSP